jgi:PMC2NT (NUC016) domain
VRKFLRKNFIFLRRSFPFLAFNDEEQVDALMDPKTYPEWQAGLLKVLVATTKAASAVGGHDISFERSIDPDFDSSLTAVTDRFLNLSNRLLKVAGSQEEDYEDEDDLEDRWGEVVDVVDSLLERAVIYNSRAKIYFRILVSMNFLVPLRRERRLLRRLLLG